MSVTSAVSQRVDTDNFNTMSSDEASLVDNDEEVVTHSPAAVNADRDDEISAVTGMVSGDETTTSAADEAPPPPGLVL